MLNLFGTIRENWLGFRSKKPQETFLKFHSDMNPPEQANLLDLGFYQKHMQLFIQKNGTVKAYNQAYEIFLKKTYQIQAQTGQNLARQIPELSPDFLGLNQLPHPTKVNWRPKQTSLDYEIRISKRANQEGFHLCFFPEPSKNVLSKPSPSLLPSPTLQYLHEIISHDLNSPIRAINGFSQFLIQDYAQVIDEDGKHFLERIQSNATKLKKMLEGLSRYFQLLYDTETNFLQISPGKLITQAFGKIQKQYPRSKSHLKMPSSLPEIRVDPILFREMLELIFDNAHKFSKERTVIQVELSYELKDDHLIFKIQDQGVGFEMAFSDRIFRLFGRLHKDSEYAGYGIGMTLAQAIAFIHQGDIWAESILNQGASFMIRLPLLKK